ncbi:hypothetical protein DID76_02940 [Candidatus Marinamargulisbacteria bacterium SCGC AG-414-C22]|nr:hypothetical protein DID76_02940 [Candidatus Marinamargulisbacteria bacterium SCGC AG-414-C22]
MYIYIYLSILASIVLITLNTILNAPTWANYPALLIIVIATLKTQQTYIKEKKQHKAMYLVNTTNKTAVLELETAKKVQQALLTIDHPENPQINIAKKCIPATTLGGDFYTFVNKSIDKLQENKQTPGVLQYGDQQNNIIGIAIGDVAGHGVSSALVMALSSGLIDRIGQNNIAPATILQRANTDIQKFISQSQISHVTAFYGSINLNNMIFTYSNAGHQPALIIHKDKSYEQLTTDGIFLGMYQDETYTEHTKQLQQGDRIFLYTDGIIEARNKKNDLYGVNRLKKYAIDNHKLNINDLLEGIYTDLNSFCEKKEAKDDQTAIIIEIT